MSLILSKSSKHKVNIGILTFLSIVFALVFYFGIEYYRSNDINNKQRNEFVYFDISELGVPYLGMEVDSNNVIKFFKFIPLYRSDLKLDFLKYNTCNNKIYELSYGWHISSKLLVDYVKSLENYILINKQDNFCFNDSVKTCYHFLNTETYTEIEIIGYQFNTLSVVSIKNESLYSLLKKENDKKNINKRLEYENKCLKLLYGESNIE